MEDNFMEKYFRIPISRREFVKVTGSAAGDLACSAAGGVDGQAGAAASAVSDKTVNYAGKDKSKFLDELFPSYGR
jgi:hypothetical protein